MRNGASPTSLQQGFWNQWNESREKSLEEVSRRQARVICEWLDALGRKDLNIIDVGCGAGWLCLQLTEFGCVTGTDLADEVLARAQSLTPDVRFVPGDFMKLDFGLRCFDVVVTLEVLSHVADQRAFVNKLASLLGTWRPSDAGDAESFGSQTFEFHTSARTRAATSVG
jgi:2-polyprenyl-3-methyl-5-hydroxy-6-metoxy-1,4-benzoquinol methylase